MTDIMNGLDAYLTGKARVDEWKEDFMASWFGPVIRVMKEMAIEGARNSPDINKHKLMGMISPEAQKKLRGE